MEIVLIVKTIVKLLVITLILYFCSLITGVDLFGYVAFITGLLMILNLYWLGISIIGYFAEKSDSSTWIANEAVQHANLTDDAQEVYIILLKK